MPACARKPRRNLERAAPKTPATGRFKAALRYLPVCLLGLVLWREKPWTVHLAANAPWAVAAAILLNLSVSLPLKAARWRLALIDPPPFRQVLAATVEGLLANAAIGFGSGDLVRAARLRSSEPLPKSKSDDQSSERQLLSSQLAIDYGCTWAERGAEALALAILVFVAALFTKLGSVALGISVAAMLGYGALLTTGRFLVPRLGRWPRIQRALSSGLQASTPRRVIAMAALSLLGWSSESVMLVLFQGAFHLEPSFRTALVTLVGINAAIAIPTLPGNFGTFEAGVTMALVMCGAPRDVAVSYALTYHLTHVIPVAVLATAVYLSRSRRYRTTPARTSTGR